MKINELILYTTSLEEQKAFYTETLGLPLLETSSTTFKVAAGYSLLIFKLRDYATPYHIAFNIPSYLDPEALAWLRKRTPVLKYQGKGLVDFVNWNARSIYFYDADQNIIELIARKNLGIQSLDAFDHHAFLSISEVGMAVNDIETTYRQLQKLSDFAIFDGSFDQFCAVGDEQGLFILINKHRKDWFPTGDKAFSSDFEIEFQNHGRLLEFTFREGEIKVTVES